LYDAFPLLFVMSGFYLAALWMIEGRMDLRPLIYSGSVIALELVINPYFPDYIVFTVRNMLPKLAETTSVSVVTSGTPHYRYLKIARGLWQRLYSECLCWV